MRNSRIAPLPARRKTPLQQMMPLIVIVLVVLVAAIYFLSTQAREVPVQPIEVDVTNAAGR